MGRSSLSIGSGLIPQISITKHSSVDSVIAS
jgi:hypothetical protein